MVSAPRVRKPRSKIALFFYALALVTLLTALSYLLYQYIGEYNNLLDNKDRYEQLVQERASLEATFREGQIDFQEIQREVDSEPDLANKAKLFINKRESFVAQLEIANKLVTLDKELLKLNIDAESRLQAEKMEAFDTLNLELQALYLETLDMEISLAQYNLALADSDECLKKIDYNASNEVIVNAIVLCQKKLELTADMAAGLGDNFPKTIAYIDSTVIYWETTKQLHESLIAKTHDQATELQAKQAVLEAEVRMYAPRSTEEIESALKGRLSEIGLLETRLAQI